MRRTWTLAIVAGVAAAVWYFEKKGSSGVSQASSAAVATETEQPVPAMPTPVLGSQAQHVTNMRTLPISNGRIASSLSRLN
jgi:hypothetical protein